jgi:hypothetical protein
VNTQRVIPVEVFGGLHFFEVGGHPNTCTGFAHLDIFTLAYIRLGIHWWYVNWINFISLTGNIDTTKPRDKMSALAEFEGDMIVNTA